MKIPSLALVVVLVAACRSAPPEASVHASAQTGASAAPDGDTEDPRARFFELTAEMHRIAQQVRLQVAIPLLDATRGEGATVSEVDAKKALDAGQGINYSVTEVENAYKAGRFADVNSNLRDIEDLAFDLIVRSRTIQAGGSEPARALTADLEKRSQEVLDLVRRARAILNS